MGYLLYIGTSYYYQRCAANYADPYGECKSSNNENTSIGEKMQFKGTENSPENYLKQII